MKPRKILFTEAEIQEAIRRLGAQITEDYRGKDLVVVAMLKGSVYLLADLTRNIDLPLQYDVIGIGKIGDVTGQTGVVRITRDLELDIVGKDVLVIEEIVRTGLTTNYMVSHLLTRGPRDVKVLALVANRDQLLIKLPLEYVGLEIDYTRVVGYGMDYREHDRNLPYIAELDKSRYENGAE